MLIAALKPLELHPTPVDERALFFVPGNPRLDKGPPRLLIMACSRRKRPDPGLLSAVERYDGPAFRVLRRFQREIASRPLRIYILSAEFGLIPGDKLIPAYDRRMTVERARELRPCIVNSLHQVLREAGTVELFVLAGGLYLPPVVESVGEVREDVRIHIASGPIGKKLSALRDWLYGAPPAPLRSDSDIPVGDALLRGVRVTATMDDISNLARRALREGRGQPCRFQSWYVPVEDERVAPKWLASQLTSLHPGRFRTTEALRFLGRLGITVQRA